MGLENKVVLVTGASRGVGAALSIEAASRGAKVVCAARGTSANPSLRGGSIDDTVAAITEAGGDAIAVAADMAREDDIRRMIDVTVEHHGRIDILVNNAAAVGVSSDFFSDMSSMDWEWQVNFRGPFLAMREAAAHMREQGEGRILSVGSLLAFIVMPSMMMYGVTKMALERLTMDVALQLKQYHIAVNVFRIDLPVSDEGFDPDTDIGRTYGEMTEPCSVAAEGIAWMLEQPVSYTGQLEGMRALREREDIMASRAKRQVPIDMYPRWSWT